MSRFPEMPMRFLQPCPHRVLGSDEAIDAYLAGAVQPKPELTKAQPAPLCMLLTKELGHTFGTSPRVCAQCQFLGTEPSQDFLSRQMANGYMALLELCHLGFYSEDDIESLVKRAFPFVRTSVKQRSRLVAVVQSCIETGKLKLNRVEAMVKTHMKELLDEPDARPGKVSLGGGAGGEEPTKVPSVDSVATSSIGVGVFNAEGIAQLKKPDQV